MEYGQVLLLGSNGGVGRHVAQMIDGFRHAHLVGAVGGAHFAGQADPDGGRRHQIFAPAHLDVADHLMGFDVHVMSHRTGVGAALALVAGRNVLTGLALYPVQEIISPVADELTFFFTMGSRHKISGAFIIFSMDCIR